MRASEKLRALEEQAQIHPAIWQQQAETVMDALPQIRALVEAAEAEVEYDPDYADVNDPNPVAAALSALDEKLP